MEKKLGRYLKKEEVVHHRNFKKSENNKQNLFLFPTGKSHVRFHIVKRHFPQLTEEEFMKLDGSVVGGCK